MVNGRTAAVAVVAQREDGAWEIKNLAVAPGLRGQGYGARLLKHLFRVFSARCDRLYVGTSEGNVPFYEHFGFVREGIIVDFFADHYDEPILENGKPLRDMIMLVKRL
jgi:ribosomal protein S18 acetylase RimI-like enzyme